MTRVPSRSREMVAPCSGSIMGTTQPYQMVAIRHQLLSAKYRQELTAAPYRIWPLTHGCTELSSATAVVGSPIFGFEGEGLLTCAPPR